MKKYLHFISLPLLTAATIFLFSCEGKDYHIERGIDAGKEFCKCINSGNALTTCNNQLNRNYPYDANNEYFDDFMTGINKEAAKCGYQIDYNIKFPKSNLKLKSK